MLLAIAGLAGVFIQQGAFADPLPMFLMAAGSAVSGLLLVPSAFYALWRLMGKQVEAPAHVLRKLQPGWWVLALPAVVLLGYLITQYSRITWLLLPVLHVLAIGLPVLWLLWLTVRGLPLGSPQRMWGVFDSGLVLAPALIAVAEIFAALAYVLLGALAIAGKPELVQRFTSLSSWFAYGSPSPEEVIQVLGPLLVKPAVILAALSFWSLVVPLIEELFKPIGVWLLAGRDLSPAAGFAAGALSGAGYALFESLALTSSGAEWTALVVARIGTSAVHILTASLTGWGMAMAWKYRRYALLGLTYLGAVFIHGLWNGLTLFSSFSALAEAQGLPLDIPGVAQLGQIAPIGLITMALAAFAALLWANWRLGRPGQVDAIPVPEPVDAPSENPEESML